MIMNVLVHALMYFSWNNRCFQMTYFQPAVVLPICTVIRIIEEDDEEAGMTLELEPMGGQVLLTDEIKDPSESLSWVPDEGPDFR